jgi:hypothetical protein
MSTNQISSSSESEYSSEEEDDSKDPLWARKAPPPPLKIHIGTTLVCYYDELLEKPPEKFSQMREEFRMMNLRQRVVDWRTSRLQVMLGYLERRMKAREDEMESLDDNAETMLGDSSGMRYVNTTIYHTKFVKTYKPPEVWNEKRWLSKHKNSSGFPNLLDLEQARMLIVERVNLMRLEIKALKAEIKSLSARAGGEAITHLQRLVRGHLGRLFAVEYRKRLALQRVNAAALQIQRVWRGSRARIATKDMFQMLEDSHREEAAPPIQAVFRGYLARKLFKLLESEMRSRRQTNMAIKLQAWYRGCAGRKVAEIVSQSRTKLQVEEDFLDSTVQIQRLLRGHLGRKKMKARKIEVKLNKRVRSLAYDYIGKGSFWEFLGAVNKDYERYNEQRVREEELASSFIHQVLNQREKQQKESWQSWNIAKLAMEKRGNAALARQRNKAARVYLTDEKGKNADEWVNKTMKTLEKQNRKGNNSRSGVRKRKGTKNLSNQGRGLLKKLGSGDSSNSSSMMMMSGMLMSGMGGGDGGKRGSGGSMSPMDALQLSAHRESPGNMSSGGSSMISEEPSAIVIGGVSIPSNFDVGQTSKSKPFKLDSGTSYPGEGKLAAMAEQYAPLTSALVEESSIMNNDPQFYDGNGGSTLDTNSGGVNPYEFDKFPGRALTLEITDKQEPIDRIMLHSALRTFIPMSSDAVTGEAAFHEFINMPRGLLKVQRESEVSRFVQPYVKILKYAGMKTIESLKHATATQLAALGLPSALAEVLCRLVRQLFKSWRSLRSSSLVQSVSGIIQPPNVSITSLGGGGRAGGKGRNLIGGESVITDEKNREMPGNAPNIPYIYDNKDSNLKRPDRAQTSDDTKGTDLGSAWPYDQHFDLRPSSSSSNVGYENAMHLAGYPDSSSTSRPGTSATINYGGTDSRPGTSMSLRDQLLSRGSMRGMSRDGVSRGSLRGGTPLMFERPGTSGGFSSVTKNGSRNASRGGSRGDSPGGSRRGGIIRSSSMPSSLLQVEPPMMNESSPSRGRSSSHNDRPGTTGNLHQQDFTSNKQPQQQQQSLFSHERPSTVGVSTGFTSPSSLPPIDRREIKSRNGRRRRASFQLAPGDDRPSSTGIGRPSTGGSRPTTSTSKASSRPSTRATVDYGFYQTINDGEEDQPILYEVERFNDGEREAATPRLRRDIENPEEQNEQLNDEISNNHASSPHSLQTHHLQKQQQPISNLVAASRPDTASELRRRLTAPMVVNDIDEPIENLVVGAAMQTYVDDNDTDATTETAFDKFIEKLLEIPKGPAGKSFLFILSCWLI